MKPRWTVPTGRLVAVVCLDLLCFFVSLNELSPAGKYLNKMRCVELRIPSLPQISATFGSMEIQLKIIGGNLGNLGINPSFGGVPLTGHNGNNLQHHTIIR